jgi:hypothetical protein
MRVEADGTPSQALAYLEIKVSDKPSLVCEAERL